jgi:hypothetical protein
MKPRRALLVAVAAFVLLVPAADAAPPPEPMPPPPTTLPADADRPQQSTGTFEKLGGGSPFCEDQGLGDIGARAEENCALSGNIANPYPSDNYGLDNNVNTSLTNPSSWIASTFQWVISVLWVGLIYLVKGVLAVLEWAFTTDIYDASSAQSEQGVWTMYEIVGRPWMPFAIAVLGLWGLWHGLVRRKAIETIGGLVAAVALMLVALVIISRPDATVGHLSQLSNQAALGALSAASAGTVERPAENLAEANRQLFDAIVLRPWCALQFGDVPYCLRERSGTTVADVWLSFTPNSDARHLLFEKTKDGGDGSSWTDDLRDAISVGWGFITGGAGGVSEAVARMRHTQNQVADVAEGVIEPSPQHVHLQESGGTMRRFAVLVVVGLGVIGAALLIGSIAIRLLIQGVLTTLVLLLLAPVALLAPAFGEAGRRAFVTYLRKLAAAIISKFIYAILLAIVVLVTNILAGLQDPLGGWLPCWIVQTVFWWSLFLRRRELLAMISLDSGRPGTGLAAIFHATQVSRDLRNMASAMTVRPVRAAIRPLRRNAHAYRHGQDELAHQQARDFAARRAREETSHEHARQYDAADAVLQDAAQRRGRQRAIRGRLAEIDRELVRTDTGADADSLRAEQARLRRDDQDLETFLASADVARARAVAAGGRDAPPMDERDVGRWIQQRRWDADNRPWDHEANLRAAGIDPGAHRSAVAAAATDEAARARVAEHQRRVLEQMRRDRVLLTAAAERSDAAPASRAERRARVRYGRDVTTDARGRLAHVAAERRRMRVERQRARVYR